MTDTWLNVRRMENRAGQREPEILEGGRDGGEVGCGLTGHELI